MIKVLHVITGLEKGGAENHVVLLSKQQIKNNYKVDIFYTNRSKYWIKNLNKTGIGTLTSNNKFRKKSFFNFLNDAFFLIKYIRKYKPDILHAHLPYMEILSFICLFFVQKKPIFIITKHVDNIFFKGSEGQKKSLIGSYLARIISSKSDKIISISKAVKKFLISKYVKLNKDKIKVIYYGLDKIIESKNDKNLHLKKRYKIQSSQIILGCVARLVYQKSLDTLIQALSINNNKKKFVLFIAGSGPLKKKLKDLIREKNLSKNIFLIDFVDDIDRFLDSVDIFVLPSLYEGLGLVFLEAMLKKKPLISTNTSAMKELIFNNYNGYLIEKKNFKQLSEVLNLLTNKKKRLAMGKRSYAFVKKKFTEKKMFQETDKLYRKLL